MPKLALSLISKNNAETIGKTLASVAKYVDGIFVTDTGSTDDTIAIAEQYGAVISHFKWVDDFSAARNYAFEQVPAEYQYILWLDTDDVLVGAENLPIILKEMAANNYTAVAFDYHYSIDPKTKQVLIRHTRERIIDRSKYQWVGRLHETLIPLGKQTQVFSQLCRVEHWPTAESIEANMDRNMRILQAQYDGEGDAKDPRTEYYLARAYFDLEEHEKAHKLFQDYLEHSGWDEERAMAWNYMGEIFKQRADYDNAIDCFMNAMKERPEFPTWYVSLAMTYALKQDWERALFWVKHALSIPEKDKTAMVMNPRDDMSKALETIFFAAFNTGKLDEAWAASQKLAQMHPGNEDLKKRFEAMNKLRRYEKMTKNALEIIEELDHASEQHKLEGFINSLPTPIMGNSAIAKIRTEVLPPKKWRSKSVVYFCGKGFERWDASSLDKGVGGSETAVIYLAKEWVKQGYEVTIYGYPVTEGTYDGVTYAHYWRCNFDDTFDVFISWRNEAIFNLPIKARLKLLDCHDVLNQADILPVDPQIDYYMVKSAYHRTYLPDIPDTKFKIISNGINIFDDLKNVERNPYQVTYVSSYDRGLETLLKIWPQVKEVVPEAELIIAYGWNLFDTIFKNNPERLKWKARMVELMSQDGVHEIGRVDKRSLHILHKQSAIMAYYCTFEEINCISVLEAQANGSQPVTTDYAALRETNRFGAKIPGDVYMKDTKAAYAKALIDALKNPMTDKKRDKMQAATRADYAWTRIAKDWIEVFSHDQNI